MRLFFIIISLYFPVFVSIITDNSAWLFMWCFVIFIYAIEDDKDNGNNNN